MIRLIYVSTVVEGFDPIEMEDILRIARSRNKRENMTGFLFFTPNHFVQCLEGDRRAVNRLYADLMRDKRHHDLMILDYSDIRTRAFADWKMAYLGPRDVDRSLLAPFSNETGFDPYALDRDAVNELIRLLASRLKEIGA